MFLSSDQSPSIDISAAVEAVLFLKGESVAVSELSKLLSISEEEVEQGLNDLEGKLQDRGLTIIRSNDRVLMTTRPELGPLIEEVLKYELQKDIGRAGRETLAIVLYKHPITKRDIDHIRGVNSSTILRTLTIRGLLDKEIAPNGLSSLYSPTTELLAHLGLSQPQDLPEYQEVKSKIETLFSDES